MGYNDPEFFQGRASLPNDIRGGYWWIELGKPWNTINDAEKIRHELTTTHPGRLGLGEEQVTRGPASPTGTSRSTGSGSTR